MDDYKGIYYNDEKQQKFFEGGAHFPYKDLYNRLIRLGGIIPESHDSSYPFVNNVNPVENVEQSDLFNSNCLENEREQNERPKSRNLKKIHLISNPNTKIFLKKKQSIDENKSIKSRNVSNSYYLNDLNQNISKDRLFYFFQSNNIFHDKINFMRQSMAKNKINQDNNYVNEYKKIYQQNSLNENININQINNSKYSQKSNSISISQNHYKMNKSNNLIKNPVNLNYNIKNKIGNKFFSGFRKTFSSGLKNITLKNYKGEKIKPNDSHSRNFIIKDYNNNFEHKTQMDSKKFDINNFLSKRKNDLIYYLKNADNSNPTNSLNHNFKKDKNFNGNFLIKVNKIKLGKNINFQNLKKIKNIDGLYNGINIMKGKDINISRNKNNLKINKINLFHTFFQKNNFVNQFKY